MLQEHHPGFHLDHVTHSCQTTDGVLLLEGGHGFSTGGQANWNSTSPSPRLNGLEVTGTSSTSSLHGMSCTGGTLGIFKASWWNAGLQQFARRVRATWSQLVTMQLTHDRWKETTAFTASDLHLYFQLTYRYTPHIPMPYMLSHFHLPHEVQVRVELPVPHRWGSRDKKYPTTPTTPTTVVWGYGSSWTFPELGEDLVGVGGTQVGGWWWRGWGLVVLVELICQLVQVVVWCEDFCLKSQECCYFFLFGRLRDTRTMKFLINPSWPLNAPYLSHMYFQLCPSLLQGFLNKTPSVSWNGFPSVRYVVLLHRSSGSSEDLGFTVEAAVRSPGAKVKSWRCRQVNVPVDTDTLAVGHPDFRCSTVRWCLRLVGWAFPREPRKQDSAEAPTNNWNLPELCLAGLMTWVARA